jgi:hypothetical protein
MQCLVQAYDLLHHGGQHVVQRVPVYIKWAVKKVVGWDGLLCVYHLYAAGRAGQHKQGGEEDGEIYGASAECF